MKQFEIFLNSDGKSLYYNSNEASIFIKKMILLNYNYTVNIWVIGNVHFEHTEYGTRIASDVSLEVAATIMKEYKI